MIKMHFCKQKKADFVLLLKNIAYFSRAVAMRSPVLHCKCFFVRSSSLAGKGFWLS